MVAAFAGIVAFSPGSSSPPELQPTRAIPNTTATITRLEAMRLIFHLLHRGAISKWPSLDGLGRTPLRSVNTLIRYVCQVSKITFAAKLSLTSCLYCVHNYI
jgi:hypothetical protein